MFPAEQAKVSPAYLHEAPVREYQAKEYLTIKEKIK